MNVVAPLHRVRALCTPVFNCQPPREPQIANTGTPAGLSASISRCIVRSETSRRFASSRPVSRPWACSSKRADRRRSALTYMNEVAAIMTQADIYDRLRLFSWSPHVSKPAKRLPRWIGRAELEATRKRLSQMLDELKACDCYMNMAWRPRLSMRENLGSTKSMAFRSQALERFRAAGRPFGR